MAIEIIDDLPEEYADAVLSLGMKEGLLDLIESVLEPRLRLLVRGAEQLVKIKLEEIDSK
ncbi:MAG: hypothetical protein IH878_00005 [Gemmatimonadetes bacterium]|nr:hypothetical protein [Gemmatimonadota bacterium]